MQQVRLVQRESSPFGHPNDLVVQEWTATATHANEMRRGDLVAPPTGNRLEWVGMDVIPFEGELIARKDVYSDSVSILRQVGLLD